MDALTSVMEEMDRRHQQDPVTEEINGQALPRELLYSNRMVERLSEFYPEYQDFHLLAAKCHHLCRWEIPRQDFDQGRAGYYAWRKAVHAHQAKIAEQIMTEEKLDAEIKDKVLKIITKKGLKKDPDVQLLEDLTCLVFLEHDFETFSLEHPEDKLIDIIKKTLTKMSPRAQEEALKINYSERVRALIEKAI